MPTYTVHAPPPRQAESVSAPERFVFVRDGFYFWAFLLAPLWLLVRRLWLALLIYVVLAVVIGLGLRLLGVSSMMRGVAELLIALGIGFEASSIWRWTLARRRWTMLGFVVAEDIEMAERRFFTEWSERPLAEAPRAVRQPGLSEPGHALSVRPEQPLSTDVIGLFPEPEARR
ncbi:MAG: DUF2628 domain-containing protein [Rhodopseudomonas sp.]|nr:DUF2628 domain-containing protein [Rhodopseudomonas sp.]